MVISIKQTYGEKLGATDGEIGRVKDFYFDDKNWAVRYVVAETEAWLTGRQVLISPYSLGELAPPGKVLRVNLTRKQIENSPSIDWHKPVSRQYEEQYHKYYDWPFYWKGNALWGMQASPVMGLPGPAPATESESASEGTDAHLRSTQAVAGYHLRATDGIIGHISDFMLDGQTWAIPQLVIKTGHRLSGQQVRIQSDKVLRISYEESTVFVNLTKAEVEQSPVHLSISAVLAETQRQTKPTTKPIQSANL
jgi:hypothetical protein